MASFDEHIFQAKGNIKFLEEINSKIGNYTDWQVTVCFYSALHLVNAHLAQFGLQYRRHGDVKHALNPEVETSLSKLPEDEYVSYTTLQMLSRRSRYLVNEKAGNINSENAHFTYEKHLAKAIKHLDKLIVYFSKRYAVKIDPIVLRCNEIRGASPLKHIELLK